jgi:Tol biopolymer transport system component
VNGRGQARVLSEAGEAAYHPAVAPVGNRLAFAHDFNNTNVWAIPISAARKAGTHKLLITSARSSYVRPNAFSPDGKRIAFESNRSGYYALWTANADGSGANLLFENGLINSGSPAWSRDGRQIAFDTRVGTKAHIFVISPDGGSAHPITQSDSDNILPTWSQDGKTLYFDSNRTGGFEIFKWTLAGGRPVQVTHGGGWGAQESPDGRTLYFTRTRAVSTPLLSMPVGGGAETELLPAVHERWWAATEKGIWFMERQGSEVDPGLWSMESAVSERAYLRFYSFASHHTTTASVIPKSPAGGLALSPDGHTILYSQVDHKAYEIALLENFR